jgi:hypothetical protein
MNGYYIIPQAAKVELWKLVAGSDVLIDDEVTTFSAEDYAGFSAEGTTLKAYKWSGTEWTVVATWTDATFADAGYTGLYTSGTDFDNFMAGPYVVPPVCTDAPTVTGTVSVGSTLTTDDGTWTGSPTSYAYQWQRDASGNDVFANITGQTAATHILVVADDGCKLRCVVTATNGAGSTDANSNTIGFNVALIGVITNAGGGGIVKLARLANAGIHHTREDIGFDGTDGTGTWLTEAYWTEVQTGMALSYDDLFYEAAIRGIIILPVVTGAWPVPADATDYAAFMAVVVARYGPGGTFWLANMDIIAYAQDYFEVWNEPYATWWVEMPSAVNYAALYIAAVTAGRATNASAKFICAACRDYSVDGGINWTEWVTDLYTAEPTLNTYLDAYSVHPYGIGAFDWDTGNNSQMIPQVEDVYGKFVANGATTQKMWITEVGWSTYPKGPPENTDPNDDQFTEAEQATNLDGTLGLIQNTWADFVAAVYVYAMEDQVGADPNVKEGWYGITDSTGGPKPAFYIIIDWVPQDPYRTPQLAIVGVST